MEAYYNLKLDLKPEETVYGFWFGVQDIYEMSKRHGKQEPDYKEITGCIVQQLVSAKSINICRLINFFFCINRELHENHSYQIDLLC
jgi:hypothetical protein